MKLVNFHFGFGFNTCVALLVTDFHRLYRSVKKREQCIFEQIDLFFNVLGIDNLVWRPLITTNIRTNVGGHYWSLLMMVDNTFLYCSLSVSVLETPPQRALLPDPQQRDFSKYTSGVD